MRKTMRKTIKPLKVKKYKKKSPVVGRKPGTKLPKRGPKKGK